MNGKSKDSPDQWVDPDDAPELMEEFFRSGVWSVGDKVVTREEAQQEVRKRRGRPVSADTKISTTIRFDADVIDAFKAFGGGWQTRMNDALKAWLRSPIQDHAPQLAHAWRALSDQQLCRHGEYLFKMKLSLQGFGIYAPEIGNNGIDFIVQNKSGDFFEIQVKAVQTFGYLFVTKPRMTPNSRRYLAFAHFHTADPALYLIPSEAWLSPNHLFKDNDGEAGGNEPEWGIDFQEPNLPFLEPYRFELMARKMAG